MATIRCLRDTDLGDCMKLKEAAGWNQTLADWQALLRWEPLGCFGIEVEGRVVSTATAVVHEGVGWIGMVLTDPLFRGQGMATGLMKHSLAYLEPLAKTVKLDASAEGEPIYRKLGFAEEAVIERWVSEGVVDAVGVTGQYTGPLRHADLPIEAVAECEGAWAAGRTGSGAWYFGPCYGESEGAVEQVARALLAGRGRAIWDLFPTHLAAAVAARLGFAPSRRLLRMTLGVPSPTPSDVYAIAGFEWG
jgi:GNAT superfamily N-acetyltransferase